MRGQIKKFREASCKLGFLWRRLASHDPTMRGVPPFPYVKRLALDMLTP
jgi:hypothetical protein